MTNEDILSKLESTLEVLAQGHRHDLIIDQSKRILSIRPNHKYALSELARSYNNTQQYDKLFKTCKIALSHWPNNVTFLYFLYIYYLYLGENDYLNAKKCIEKAIQLEPQVGLFHRELGEIYLINWEPKKSLPCLQKAVELSPDKAEFRSRLALAYLRCRDKQKSLDLATKALKDEPDDPKVMDTVGMILLLVGKLDEAEDLFKEALRKNPTYDYFQKHLNWVVREKADKIQRYKANKQYTPLYLRQKGTKRFFK